MPVHIIVKNTRTIDMTIDQQVALDEALTFDDLPFEEEILAFLRHNGEIRKLTDVNINKLHQLWRSFAAIINKRLSRKSTGYDSLRLSQAQILWGMYHKKNVDFAYLLWEDFVYQVEHKDAKKSNEMYYPRFTKVIIHYFMTKDPSIPRRNKLGVMLPIELTNKDIRNSKAYKEYYAVASGAAPPKTKASVRKTKSSFNTTVTPPTVAGTRLSTSAKGKQPAKASKAKSLTMLYEKSSDEDDDDDDAGSDDQDDDQDDDDQDEGDDEDQDEDKGDDNDQDEGNDDDQDTDDEGDEFIHPRLTIHEEEETKDEESFDPIVQTPENSDDEGNDDASLRLNVGSKEGQDAEDDEDELYRDVNINLEGRDVQMTDVHTTQEFKDTHVTPTLVNPDGQQQSSSVSSQFITSMLNPSPDAGIDSFFETPPQIDVPTSTTVVSFTLTELTLPPLTILIIKVAVQIQSDRLRDKAQAENEEFLKNINENIQKIIKEQVKEQVKKILIEKIESNKSIHRSDEQMNIYKALVEAYESEKIILDTYRDTVMLKRRRNDVDKDEEPSAGSDRGSKRRREGKEPGSTSALKEKATKATGKSTQGSKSQQKTTSKSTPSEEPMQTTQDLEKPSHQEFKTGAADDQPISQEPVSYEKHDLWGISHWWCKRQQFYGFVVNRESARDVYSKRRINVVTELQIVEWHNYKHLDWMTVRRDDDKLYKFKEGDFKRMFTKSIVIQRRVEDLQLGVESYQNKLNLTKPDTYRSDMKRKEAYTAYSNPRGFIYQNKDKQNRLMRIDELHKFSDGTLNDVRTAMDDRLKGIRMKYLPQAI
nr:hypothetical protein [Tanacetum cinerariifolium]